jgi:hypothetical protein
MGQPDGSGRVASPVGLPSVVKKTCSTCEEFALSRERRDDLSPWARGTPRSLRQGGAKNAETSVIPLGKGDKESRTSFRGIESSAAPAIRDCLADSIQRQEQTGVTRRKGRKLLI